MQMVRFSSSATRRKRSMICACSSCVPWEKFSRATSMPRRMRSRRTGSELHAGPIVQIIFARRSARRMSDAAGGASTGVLVTFRVDFLFFKVVPTRIRVGLIIVYGELLLSQTPETIEGDKFRTKVRPWHRQPLSNEYCAVETQLASLLPRVQRSRCQASL